MTDLTMIGLGAMGSALANAFLTAGHDLAVWNRTPSRTAPFEARGARALTTIAAAVEASPVIVVCIDNYEATRTLITENGLGAVLAGRTLVQLSTGSPNEARDLEGWMRDFDCAYIDGAILPYPDGIGEEDAMILFSGSPDAWSRCEPLLRCLGGGIRYLGASSGAAAALDMAYLTHDLCCYLGVIHGAHICESENISVGELASMFAEGSTSRAPVDVIHSGDYDGPGATLTVWNGALERIRIQARDAGINCEVPDFIAGFFRRAIAAGHGEEDVAAIIKVMRDTGNR